MHASSKSIETVSTVRIFTTSKVLKPSLHTITQNTVTTVHVYQDFYLPDILFNRSSKLSWQATAKLSADENPAVVATINNLTICYSIDTYSVHKQMVKYMLFFLLVGT